MTTVKCVHASMFGVAREYVLGEEGITHIGVSISCGVEYVTVTYADLGYVVFPMQFSLVRWQEFPEEPDQ